MQFYATVDGFEVALFVVIVIVIVIIIVLAFHVPLLSSLSF